MSFLLNLCYLGSSKTKTFKNINDVRILVQRGTSMPQSIRLAFRSWKCIKICQRVVNRCLTYFMVKTFGYKSPRFNQGPLKRTFVLKQTLSGECAQTGQSTIYVWTDRESMPPSSNKACTVYELINGCVGRRGEGLSTHRRPVVGGLVYEGRVFCVI